MLQEISQKVQGLPYLFFAKVKGLRANDFAQFRRSLDKTVRNCFMVKNTLLKKVFEKEGIKTENGILEGSIVLVTADKDPQIVSKLLVEFSKDKESFQLAGAWAEGEIHNAAFVKELAKLPSRTELLAKVVGGMKSPITGFVLDLRGLLSSFLNVLDQVSQKKQA
jgi:large subunit ribosomal protein L10